MENCLKERGDVLSIREPSVMKLAAGSLVSKGMFKLDKPMA